jgi:tetratricopeptide (TPR) repeat protein
MHNNYKCKSYTNSMQAQRINFLQEQIKTAPQEPFNYYAMALEFRENEPEQASSYFDLLLEKFPDYLPTYYLAADLFFNQTQYEKATATYQAGIELATRLKKEKTLRELKSAYALFLNEINE